MHTCWPSPRNITERMPNLIQTSLHNKLPEQGPTSTQLHNEKITNTCTWTERHVQLCKRNRDNHNKNNYKYMIQLEQGPYAHINIILEQSRPTRTTLRTTLRTTQTQSGSNIASVATPRLDAQFVSCCAMPPQFQ